MKTVLPKQNSLGNWMATLFFLFLTSLIFYAAIAYNTHIIGIIAISLINGLPFYIAFRALLILIFHRIEFDEQEFAITTIFGIKKTIQWVEVEKLDFRTFLGTSIKVWSKQGNFIIYEGGFHRFHEDTDRFLQRLNDFT